MKILITGSSGLIGRQLVSGLESEHDLRLGDVTGDDRDPRFVHLDVTDPEDARRAVDGVDAVVHLAIASGREGDYEDAVFNRQRFNVNVYGTHNVLEAARRANVRRFVFTSSLMVVWGYPPPAEVASDAAPRPVGTYALTKRLGETLCEQAARDHGLSCICLRIPKPVDVGDAAWKRRTLRPQWIAFPDLVEAYRCAVTAADVNFDVVTIVGESTRRRWDLSKAERVIGYRPTHRLENEGFTIGEEDAPLIQPLG